MLLVDFQTACNGFRETSQGFDLRLPLAGGAGQSHGQRREAAVCFRQEDHRQALELLRLRDRRWQRCVPVNSSKVTPTASARRCNVRSQMA